MGQFNSSTKAESFECLLQQSYSIPNYNTPTSISFNKQIVEKFRFHVNKNSKYKEGTTSFVASLLDCTCRPISKGIIELKSNEISFKCTFDGKLFDFVWPLHQIRWYGGNSSLFIFETGRLCKLGSAHFIFRCKRATNLLSAVDCQVKALAASQSILTQLLHAPKKDITYTSYIGSDFEQSLDFSSVDKLVPNRASMAHACQPSSSPTSLDYISYPQILRADRDLLSDGDGQSQLNNVNNSLNDQVACDNQWSYNYLQIMPNTTGIVVTDGNGNVNNNHRNVDLEDFGQYLIALSTDRNTTSAAAAAAPTRMTINSAINPHQSFSNPCMTEPV